MTLTSLRTYPATVPESGDRCDGCAKYLLPGSVAEYRVVDGAVFHSLECAALHPRELDTSKVTK